MSGDTSSFMVMMAVLVLGISFHEFSHAITAYAAGDDTPKLDRRLTLNPLAHLDPFGTMMIVISSWAGFGIGWGKPVRVNPTRMRNPRWDHFASVAAGPVSNLIQATIYAIVLRIQMRVNGLDASWLASSLTGAEGVLPQFFVLGVLLNIGLFLFNLIPLGPLDGHWMIGTFLPERARISWYMWNRQAGSVLFLMLLLLGQFDDRLNLFGSVLRPIAQNMFAFLVGI